MVARDAVGYEGEPYDFPVEQGKIRELARSLGSTQPAYLADDAPMPPTFPKLAQFYWEPPEASVIDRIAFPADNPPLHATQEFEFHGAVPRAGARLTVGSRVESIEDRPSRTYGYLTYVVVATDYLDEHGALAVTARTTSVVTPKQDGAATTDGARA